MVRGLPRRAVGGGRCRSVEPVVDVAAPALPRRATARAAADRLAAQALAGSAETRVDRDARQRPATCCTPRRSSATRTARPTGVVVATDYLTGELAARSRRMTQAYEDYNQLRVLQAAADRRLPVVLPDGDAADSGRRHLDGAVPRQAHHAAGADAGGRGARDRRRPPRSARRAAERRRVRLAGRGVQRDGRRAGDQPPARSSARRSSSSASTSRSKGGAATSRRSSSASPPASSRSTPAARSRRSTAPRRGCSASTATIVGQPARAVFDRADLQPLGALLAGAGRGKAEPAAQEIALTRDGQELHLAAVATPLRRRQRRARRRGAGARRRDAADPRAESGGVARGGAAAGARDQESADADPALAPSGCAATSPARRPTRERSSTSARTTIVGEVESLKGLVDEFSQFARMPAPRTVPTDLHAAARPTRSRSTTASSPTCASSSASRRSCRWCGSTPSRSAASSSTSSTTPSRRWSAAAQIVVETQHDRGATASSGVVVADDGPGIPPAEREKLFLPYYSTKRRGSGLGLAIVRRIVAEHGGSIDVGDNTPRGTRFTIELPC